MKKKIYLVSALVAMAMCTMFISCKKDSNSNNEPTNGCKCTFVVDGERFTEKFDIEDMEDYYDVKSCSKLQKLFKEEDYFDSVTCKEY